MKTAESLKDSAVFFSSSGSEKGAKDQPHF
ncbi:hypothetical protein P872_07150 [Rhodonellum psychrophilum GCM71 = DSM 17998]|uniref:Uncharacterized protein n=1 Tax=Rhodonellum psychrophilum GCM71 = DSM 17998 TaxID=1123057 RepID=U5BZR8_9BACT|nr:hypothetical protein P872_07150 [Rhodonellum psychrophilum GCM71 = DSM 17998]